jgi:anaphase-promoting complex subunit 4
MTCKRGADYGSGQYLAVSWSDETVDVISTETGNSLQNFRQVTNASENKVPTQSEVYRPVTCLGWGLSLVDFEAAKLRTKPSAGKRSNESNPAKQPAGFSKPMVTLDDFLDRDPDLDTIDIPLELPDQLAQFDVTDLMPKLATLPVLPASAYKSGQHTSAELFASQVSLDAALHRGATHELDALNSFLLSDSRGSIRLIFYDSLSIGSVYLPNDWNFERTNHLKHASHPFAHSHVLLSQVCIDSENSKLVLTPLSLRFLKSAGRNIHFIDFKTAQLTTLLQYVGESILAVHHHWKHALDVPARFQRNISETLNENEEPNLAQSLYQLAATGHCSDAITEWLTEELAERVCHFSTPIVPVNIMFRATNAGIIL